MNKLRQPSSRLESLTPYDPRYLPARVILSANENPCNVDESVRAKMLQEIVRVNFNRYPDPLADDLRGMIAQANGIDREWVLMGNGGDELLFDLALAWGGTGRVFLNFPPTFSAYELDARLTGTDIVAVPRCDDFQINTVATLECLNTGKIDYAIVGSPNNPTGLVEPFDLIDRMLSMTDALIMVDEAYYEFSGQTVLPLLENHKNLVILRTFSKAYSLAGVRMGYIFAHPDIVAQFKKVRQPYSVDAVSQAIARIAFENRSLFEPGIQAIIDERARVFDALCAVPQVQAFPTDANWVLFRVDDAPAAWQYLYDQGILVRSFNDVEGLKNTLRVTIGTREENDEFLDCLSEYVTTRELQ